MATPTCIGCGEEIGFPGPHYLNDEDAARYHCDPGDYHERCCPGCDYVDHLVDDRPDPCRLPHDQLVDETDGHPPTREQLDAHDQDAA